MYQKFMSVKCHILLFYAYPLYCPVTYTYVYNATVEIGASKFVVLN